MVQKRSAEKEAYWRGVLREFEASDERVEDFCRRMNVSQPSLYKWRREIAKRDRELGEEDRRFVSVNVVDPVARAAAKAVEVANGKWTVRIEGRVDAEQLREVLSVINSLRQGSESC